MTEYMQYIVAFFRTAAALELIVILAVVLVPFWKICSKAGRSPWLSLLLLLPFVNVVFLWWLAFSKWPALPEPNTVNLDSERRNN